MTSLSLASLGASGSSPGGGSGSLAKQVFGETGGEETPFSPLLFLKTGQAGRAGFSDKAEGGGGESPTAFLLQLLSPGLLQNLPSGAGGAEDSASALGLNGTGKTPEGQSPLLTLLSGLREKAGLSATLQALLEGSGQTLGMAELQQRFNALEEDKQQALLGEMAALLAASLTGAGPLSAPAASLSLSDLSPVTEKGAQADGGTRAGLAAALQAELRAALANALTTAGTPGTASTDHQVAGSVSPVSDPASSAQPGSTPDNRPDLLTSGVTQGRDVATRDGGVGALTLAQLQASGLAPRAVRDSEKTKGDGESDTIAPVGAKTSHATDQVVMTSTSPSTSAVPVSGITGSATSRSDGQTTLRLSSISASGSGGTEATPGSGDGAGMAADSSLTGTLNPEGKAGLPGSAGGAGGVDAPRGTGFAEHLARINRHGAFAPVTDQVAVHLSRGVRDGQDRMTIRLHPAELGRIEVKLDMTADGRVSASFAVDQPATLDLLQRDQKGLERALSDAGLKSESGSLNFSLRDGASHHGQHHQQTPQDNRSGAEDGAPRFSLDLQPEEIPAAGQIDVTWFLAPNRLDVRI